jgi:hypothetical protein
LSPQRKEHVSIEYYPIAALHLFVPALLVASCSTLLTSAFLLRPPETKEPVSIGDSPTAFNLLVPALLAKSGSAAIVTGAAFLLGVTELLAAIAASDLWSGVRLPATLPAATETTPSPSLTHSSFLHPAMAGLRKYPHKYIAQSGEGKTSADLKHSHI